MIGRIWDTVLSHPLIERLVFNDLAGLAGQYLDSARDRRQYRRYRDRYDVDPTFAFRGRAIELYGRGTVELGADSYIGHHSRIQAKEGACVTVGENTAISHFVFAYTENRAADQDMGRAPNRNRHLTVRRGDVEVGADCWIGAFSMLTEGSTVGDDTVVGAHSVVTRDLPPHCIAAGAPARVRRFKSHLDPETRAELAAAYSDVLADGVDVDEPRGSIGSPAGRS